MNGRTKTERPSFADFDPRDLVARKVAAGLLDVSHRSLEAWAVSGKGPRYVRLGEGPGARVRYQVGALLAWVEERARASTTEDGAAA